MKIHKKGNKLMKVRLLFWAHPFNLYFQFVVVSNVDMYKLNE